MLLNEYDCTEKYIYIYFYIYIYIYNFIYKETLSGNPYFKIFGKSQIFVT